jgi:NAD/NADP transhydrogenase beta subunit
MINRHILTREVKYLTYSRVSVIITVGFWSEIMQARKTWSKIFKLLNEKGIDPKFYMHQHYSSKVKI